MIVQVNIGEKETKSSLDSGYVPPKELVTGERFFQIFSVNSPELKQNQLNDLVEKYKNN